MFLRDTGCHVLPIVGSQIFVGVVKHRVHVSEPHGFLIPRDELSLSISFHAFAIWFPLLWGCLGPTRANVYTCCVVMSRAIPAHRAYHVEPDGSVGRKITGDIIMYEYNPKVPPWGHKHNVTPPVHSGPSLR